MSAAALLLGCPSPSLRPLRVALPLEGGAASATVELSRRQICWPYRTDPQGAGDRLALQVNVELSGDSSTEEPWTIRRATDGGIVRTIPAGNGPGALASRVIILEHVAGHDLDPGSYVVSVPIRRSGAPAMLQAPFEVLRCVFY